MEMYYKKEGINSFAILPFNREGAGRYQDNLFQYHEVPHFLQYEIRQTNGKESIYYHLKYRTTMKTVMGHLPFTIDRIKNMVESIIGVLETAEDYLLDINKIIWSSENIFVEADSGRLLFCYYPDGDKQIGSLKDFLMEIMQATDKKQEEAVLFVLQFYNLVTEENCSLEEIREFKKKRLSDKYKKEMEHIESEEIKNGLFENENFYEEQKNGIIQNSTKEKADKEKESRGCFVVKILLVGTAVFDMILILCLVFEVLTYGYMKYLFIGLCALIVLTVLYMQMSKEETPDEMMQHFFEEQKNQKTESALYVKNATNPSGKLFNEVSTEEKWGETRLLTEEKVVFAEVAVVEDVTKQLCLSPLEEGKYPKIYFDEKSIVIGCMTESCNYVLKEEGISRMHAKLIPKLDGNFLLDLNSTNGTYLNGELIESGREYKLEEGDMVVFARCEFYVVVEY